MKKIILISSVLLCVVFRQTAAQETPDDIVPGTYYQDHVITNYAGTWKWTSGTEEFTIVLVKKKWNLDLDDYFVDVLSGGYRYVKNGVEVINTLGDVNININNDTGPFASLQSFIRDGNRIGFHFEDRLKPYKQGYKQGSVSTVITPSGNTYKMTWKLSGTGLIVSFPGDPPYPQGYSVPIDMVLTKQ